MSALFESKKLTVVLVLLTLAVFWKIQLHHFLLGRIQLWDFDIYYNISSDVIKGQSPYSLPYMQTAGPPLVIAFFLPFLLVPLQVARGLMIGLSVGAVFLSCYYLAKVITKKPQVNTVLLLQLVCWLLFLPRYNLNVGQPNLILMLLITLLVTTQNERLKTFCLSIMILIKTLYVFIFLSLLKSQRRILYATGVVLIGVGILMLPILKPSFYQEYLQQRVSGYVVNTPVIKDVDYYNQSLRSTIARLRLARYYLVVYLLVVVTGAVVVIKTGDVGAGILFSLLISPVAWQHYLVVVYPLVVLMWREHWQQKKLSWLLLIGTALLFSHIPWLHGKQLTLLTGILASHFYIALLLLFLARVKYELTTP